MTSIFILKKKRKTWISNDFAQAYPRLIMSTHYKNQLNRQCTMREPRLSNLLKLIYPLLEGWHSFSNLYIKSQIRYKKSFCDMLGFCIQYQLIEQNDDGYQLTTHGKTLLMLFQ